MSLTLHITSKSIPTNRAMNPYSNLVLNSADTQFYQHKINARIPLQNLFF